MRRARFAPRLAAPIIAAAMATILFGAQGALASPTVTWTSLANVPSVGQGVEGMATGVINGQIIAAMGFDPGTKRGDTDTTRIYDIASNTWSSAPSLIDPATRAISRSCGMLSK